MLTLTLGAMVLQTSYLMKPKKIGKEIGVTQIELDVWSFNEPAVNLYEKLGFSPQKIKMELKI